MTHTFHSYTGGTSRRFDTMATKTSIGRARRGRWGEARNPDLPAGAAKAIALVMPELNGQARRGISIPGAGPRNVSLVDF